MSLTLNQAREAVYLQFKTNWDILHPGALYFFENLAGATPTVDAYWSRVTMRSLDDRQDTLGAPGTRQYRREAAVWVQLYGPLNVGTLELDTLAHDVRTIFEGTSFGGIDGVGAVRVTPLGNENSKWYEVAVVCPITYYETR